MAAIRKNDLEVTINTVLNKNQYKAVKEIQEKYRLKTQGMAVAKIIELFRKE